MKKIFLMLFLMLAIISVSACSDEQDSVKTDTEPTEETSSKKSNSESTDKESSETEDQSNNDKPAESKQEILTVQNNEELAAVLAVKDPYEPIVGEFAEKYAGGTIEFNGNIADMMPHGNSTTRYDILIYAGDYSETNAIGPSFKFEDVSISDLNLTGSEIPDTIGAGQNLIITAVVEEYNESSGLFILEPVSTEIR
ncbi:hypothetical protein A8F94_20080 [Bacillus sp. FJAT-27225]|uniref:DUF4839 domain-containing protein n=1 Tax=Bacillus sp. FJAT-27225 TaxID=1743144 RepID=UPI00080C32CE|nr:DUF4839 domain-containing protein [Bacillus sp. FJAT-27225]OCA82215.1 hypothetical protein A8F94_20080 [Bacillus sp. FJAT-27225]